MRGQGRVHLAVVATILAAYMGLAPRAEAQEMVISFYEDGWTNGDHSILYTVVDAEDLTAGCNHWDYEIEVQLSGSSGSSWDSSSGTSVETSLPNYGGGSYSVSSDLSFFCDCGGSTFWAGGSGNVQAPPQCNDERGTMIQEYVDHGVGFTPACGDFASSGGSANFSWSELNGGFSNGNPHSPWGMVSGSLTSGLEDTRSNYNRGGILLTSGYRCAHGNAAVGGVANSRHMWGDAADMYSAAHPWTQTEFDLLKAAADATGPSESLNWSTYTDHHYHAAW